jgi:N-acetylmuramoyl-L-alanine amidase-like
MHRSNNTIGKPTLSRRSFIGQLAFLVGGAAIPPSLLKHSGSADKFSDEQLLQRKFVLATKEALGKRPMGEVMVAIGVSFLGTPYVANTLEQPGPEHLVVNLRGLDCVTFVENTLALSRCVKLDKQTREEFEKELRRIRYRDGKIDGYPSRLHYFSDWIDNNAAKGIIRNVTEEIGGVPCEKVLNFMSTHPASYKQLANDKNLEKIRGVETAINSRHHYYIPKDRLGSLEEKIEAGDIIGITTSVEGLDIGHTGIAIRTNGVLRYLHAPLSKGKVQISEQSLVEYLHGSKQTGVMVARPLQPAQ